MPVQFGESERYVLSLFSRGTQFYFNNTLYTVVISGKPTCARGEPKTDIYVQAKSDYDVQEIKISFKQENADFLENKTNSERAEQLFGPNWQNIISQATRALANEFMARPLIYKSDYRRTERGAITLGWKFELTNVLNGALSANMLLSERQVVDVYSGSNLSLDKRDASVNGIIIRNSGIANYILFEDDLPASAQEAINRLITINEYAHMNPNVYYACKALNYRSFLQKYDGNRPLAVYVDWRVVNNQLTHRLVFDEPLLHGGNEIANQLCYSLRRIGASTTNDLNYTNVADRSIIYG